MVLRLLNRSVNLSTWVVCSFQACHVTFDVYTSRGCQVSVIYSTIYGYNLLLETLFELKTGFTVKFIEVTMLNNTSAAVCEYDAWKLYLIKIEKVFT